MVIIKIPQNPGEVGEDGKPVETVYKQYGSRPLSFGLQKAFARYSATSMRLYVEAKSAGESEFSMDDSGSVARYAKIAENTETLYNEKAALIFRAFGNQFTADELDEVDADEVNRVIAQLQLEANGTITKNA